MLKQNEQFCRWITEVKKFNDLDVVAVTLDDCFIDVLLMSVADVNLNFVVPGSFR